VGRAVRPGQRRRRRDGPEGKRVSPGDDPGLTIEGQQAADQVSTARRQTSSRRQLARRHDRFEQISPELGALDEAAFDDALAADQDAALALLADLVGATDAALRALARALAGRVVVDLATRGVGLRGGRLGRLRTRPLTEPGTDLDVDASLDALAEARAARRPPALDELAGRRFDRPSAGLCLLVDRSGSMAGERLAGAAVAAASVALRAPADHSIVAFGEKAIVVKAQTELRSPEAVVDDLLALRGHGTTDLAQALHTARVQLARSGATRRVVVLLSDCRATAGADPDAELAALDEVVVVAPAGDADDARLLATRAGATLGTYRGPSSLVAVLSELLGG